MHRRVDQDAEARELERGLHRLGTAELADEDDIGVLATGAADRERCGERLRCCGWIIALFCVATDSDTPSYLNNDGYHELIEQKNGTGADPLQLDSATTERLAGNSDYRILVDASNNVTVFKGASTTALSAASRRRRSATAARTT